MSSTSPSAVPVASPAAAPEDVYVRRILAAEDFPAFSKVMSDLMASLRDDDASAQRLANLVLRDYALTVKVIRTANTVHYNRSGRAVQSATHALMLLGARTVRDLASGLLLFEQYRRRSPGLKELMLLSLLTASHAREVAARLPGTDPETAQLCGMFRNLGEVLVAAHLPSEYAEVLKNARERRDQAGNRAGASATRAQAAFAVLGCSFEDIGVAMAKHWGMPDVVRRGMRASGAVGEDTLELATAFGNELSAAIYREDEANARDAVARVLKSYGKRLDLTRDTLAVIADAAVVETRETFASARVALDDLRLTRQIANALSETKRKAAEREDGEGEDADGAPLAATPAGAQPAIGADIERGPPVSGPALAALRERLAHDLAVAVADVGAYETQRALLVALEAALRGGPFDRACFCAIDLRVGEIRARFGLGEGVEALVEGLALPFASGAATTGAAVLRGEEVILSLATRQSLGDAQLLRVCGAASAGLFPVAVDGTTIGAIYVDRRGSSLGFDGSTSVYLRRIVGSASHALALRRGSRGGGQAASAPAVAPTESANAAGAASHGAPRSAADKAELVLRVLRGEPLEQVADEQSVAVSELARWRDDFLAGAMARLANG